MKTIEHLGFFKRVSDEEARKLVSTGIWKYCPKRIWKDFQKKEKEDVQIPKER